ncbi:uncharacterized protein LOC124299596 [Neodiprion virginianus]|uniref:uncharacterized protein LOC124299596 n=1 Tax=Neodiprion virginianus TaxID=2961670 RepID=UPI001EE6D1FD|nr:uncharacterized protein LOC124299596 [Neodiprion virginianus]
MADDDQSTRTVQKAVERAVTGVVALVTTMLDIWIINNSKADIPKARKHPIILPSRHYITIIKKLIIKKGHVRLQQCGSENLLCSLRSKYWILSGRREARKVKSSYFQCFRSKPKIPEVMMGDRPSERVHRYLRPFTTTGVDYVRPLQVRENRRRGRVHSSKARIAVFTYFAIKAIHLELLTELTTEAFLAGPRRFVARRDICSKIISDNGTNFVGAAQQLKKVFEFLKNENNVISKHLSRQKTDWKFIPPKTPHFGGLWRTAVKATKRYLKTVTKGMVPTFKEYYTLLVEIESISSF